MGRPVKIIDLARNIIRLSGFEPDKDIPIKILGMRPGEKISEELINTGERTQPTEFEKIVKVCTEPLDLEALKSRFADLEKTVSRNDDEAVRRFLAETIPGYGSAAGK